MNLPIFVLGILFWVAPQATQTFKVRLSPVPMDATMRTSVTGKGAATATLQGKKLSINGTFEGLASPATVARLHQTKAMGVRGTAFADLDVSKAVTGSVSGSITLTAEQIDSL